MFSLPREVANSGLVRVGPALTSCGDRGWVELGWQICSARVGTGSGFALVIRAILSWVRFAYFGETNLRLDVAALALNCCWLGLD
jgi:hypothetical protein